ncbi:MAG: hypothetical protein SO366_02785 [Atopobiaceae bacterium]|nr:hypothetical protein [Atopobiaceae bacterium]
MQKTHIMSDETGKDIVTALQGLATKPVPAYDSKAGRYTNASLKAWLVAGADGKAYGVSVPKSAATACTKTGANAGMTNPVPGIIGRRAVDPYEGIGAFRFYEVNGGVSADGMPYVTAIQGDGRFSRDGSNGDVWIMTPVLNWKCTETDDAVSFTASDAPLAELEKQPQAYLPDGSIRPYMLYAKYALVSATDGLLSCSGRNPRTYDVSFNTLIDIANSLKTGYSGKTHADDWYVKLMFLLKYSSKSSQSVFAGCTGYDVQVAVTKAETGTRRVIVSKTDAAKFVVGSTVSVGSKSGDRGNSTTHDIADRCKITSIDAIDDSNSALTLDSVSTFDTATTQYVTTYPWQTGACDAVEGDGSPYDCMSGKEPFVIQGIELGLGMYEIIGNVIFDVTGSGTNAIVCTDTRKLTKNSKSGFSDSDGIALPAQDADADVWGLYPTASKHGFIVQQGRGGGDSKGICDDIWLPKKTTAATLREWQSLGGLWNWGVAGLFFANAWSGLTDAWWYIGSRASATGRGGEAAA